MSHEAGNLNSIDAVLGNDVAIMAYREGKLPFPEGTIIAPLHYGYVPSAENNKVSGQAQSFVPALSTNIQFMVKDSRSVELCRCWRVAEVRYRGCIPERMEAAVNFNSKRGRP